MADLIVKNTRDLQQLAKDLRKASNGKELRKAFTAQVRDALRPLVPEVRAAYLAAASGGHASASKARQGQPDLRVLLAKATAMQVRTSGKQAAVSVKVSGKKMPSGLRALPRYWEGEKPRWRHPTFNNRSARGWVQQPRQPRRTFYGVVIPHQAQVAAAVNRAADEVRRKLERPGGGA